MRLSCQQALWGRDRFVTGPDRRFAHYTVSPICRVPRRYLRAPHPGHDDLKHSVRQFPRSSHRPLGRGLDLPSLARGVAPRLGEIHTHPRAETPGVCRGGLHCC